MSSAAGLITATIHETARQWISTGLVESIAQIGDGQCDEFAHEVMDKLAASTPDLATQITFGMTEEYWSHTNGQCDAFCADIARLRREHAPLPNGIDDLTLSHAIGGMTHVWLIHDGVHYDATAPEGRSHFLLMPFFADQIDRMTETGEAIAPSRSDP